MNFATLFPELKPVLDGISESGPMLAVKSSSWAMPMILCSHVLALTVLAGAILLPGLRLMGIGMTSVSASTIERTVRPWLIGALIVLAISGSVMVMANPMRALFTPAFFVKVISFIPALILSLGVVRSIASRDGVISERARIFAGIAARIPAEGKSILDSRGGPVFTAVCIAALAIVVGVVFVEQGQRRIPVQYAKRMVGRKMYGGTSTYLPLKVNQAGVIPVIFASSLIYIPHLITQLVQSGKGGPGNGWWDRFVADHLTNPADPVYVGIYFGLIIFFTYFYVSVTFNPVERADEMKKFGGFIPGIRPGKPTADYLSYVLNRITLPGSIYLGLIAVLPNLFLQVGNSSSVSNLPFGGTAVLIAIGVGLDTVKQIESQLMQRNYEGFLK